MTVILKARGAGAPRDARASWAPRLAPRVTEKVSYPWLPLVLGGGIAEHDRKASRSFDQEVWRQPPLRHRDLDLRVAGRLGRHAGERPALHRDRGRDRQGHHARDPEG